MKFIVTAGGQGKKLWPLSRVSRPKQFQSIVGKKPLYQQTIETLLKAYKPSDIFISTKKRYFKLAKQQSPQIPAENYIPEPDISKDRGPGEGLAFLILSMKHPDEPFMIVQPDCLRVPEGAFIRTLVEAEKIVKKDKKFISGGIKTTNPVFGVDYLKLGKRISRTNKVEFYKTIKLIPRNEDFYKTKKLIKGFRTVIHCNHNCWYPDLMLDAYKKYRPDWYEGLMKIKDVLLKKGSQEEIDKIYSQMEAGPTELVTNNLFKDSYTILLPYKWTDIGTWDSIYEFFDENEEVYIDGNVMAEESDSSLIKNENDKKIIATYGVKNLIIVNTKDALLVCDRKYSKNVNDIVANLRKKKLTQYL